MNSRDNKGPYSKLLYSDYVDKVGLRVTDYQSNYPIVVPKYRQQPPDLLPSNCQVDVDDKVVAGAIYC